MPEDLFQPYTHAKTCVVKIKVHRKMLQNTLSHFRLYLHLLIPAHKHRPSNNTDLPIYRFRKELLCRSRFRTSHLHLLKCKALDRVRALVPAPAHLCPSADNTALHTTRNLSAAYKVQLARRSAASPSWRSCVPLVASGKAERMVL